MDKNKTDDFHLPLQERYGFKCLLIQPIAFWLGY